VLKTVRTPRARGHFCVERVAPNILSIDCYDGPRRCPLVCSFGSINDEVRTDSPPAAYYDLVVAPAVAVCKKRLELMRAYNAAVVAFGEAVKLASSRLQRREYEGMPDLVAARAACNCTKAKLKAHRAKHGC
jgi:hypothetical protein